MWQNHTERSFNKLRFDWALVVGRWKQPAAAQMLNIVTALHTPVGQDSSMRDEESVTETWTTA